MKDLSEIVSQIRKLDYKELFKYGDLYIVVDDIYEYVSALNPLIKERVNSGEAPIMVCRDYLIRMYQLLHEFEGLCSRYKRFKLNVTAELKMSPEYDEYKGYIENQYNFIKIETSLLIKTLVVEICKWFNTRSSYKDGELDNNKASAQKFLILIHKYEDVHANNEFISGRTLALKEMRLEKKILGYTEGELLEDEFEFLDILKEKERINKPAERKAKGNPEAIKPYLKQTRIIKSDERSAAEIFIDTILPRLNEIPLNKKKDFFCLAEIVHNDGQDFFKNTMPRQFTKFCIIFAETIGYNVTGTWYKLNKITGKSNELRTKYTILEHIFYHNEIVNIRKEQEQKNK